VSVHLRVRVGLEKYAIAIADVREVDVLAEPTSVPGAGPYVRGLQGRRGELLPVLDLPRLLGVPGGKGKRGVVVERAGVRAILPVDAAEEVEDLPESADPPAIGAALVSGSVMASERLIGILDVGEILHQAARTQ
jgi:chemotaxis signal transduction protein